VKQGGAKPIPTQVCNGWKEIADYLGKGVRTVQRYERQLKLPVRRPAQKSRGSVIALKAELDGWVQASPIRNTFLLDTGTLEKKQAETIRKSIHDGITQMKHLRDEVTRLENEVRGTVELLRDSLTGLNATFVRDYWRDPSTLLSTQEWSVLREDKTKHKPKTESHFKPS
jgi:hypothetical protein